MVGSLATASEVLAAGKRHRQKSGSKLKETKHTSKNISLISISAEQGRHLSYQRGKRNTNPNTSLIKIEGADTQEHAKFYCGRFLRSNESYLDTAAGVILKVQQGILIVFGGIQERR